MKLCSGLAVLSLLALTLGSTASENGLTFVYQPLDGMGEIPIEVCQVPLVTGGAYPEVFFDAITAPHVPQQLTPHKVGDINLASRAGLAIQASWDGREGGGSGPEGREQVVLDFDFSKVHQELMNEELIRSVLKCVQKTGSNKILHSKITGGENYYQFVKMIQEAIPASGEKASVPVNPVRGLPARDELIRDLAVITSQDEMEEARAAATKRLASAREGYERLRAAIKAQDSIFDYPGLLSLGRSVYNEKEHSYTITLGVPPLPGEGPEQGSSPSEYQVVFFGEKISSVKPVIYKH